MAIRSRLTAILTAFALVAAGLSGPAASRSTQSAAAPVADQARAVPREQVCQCSPFSCGLECEPLVCVALEESCGCGLASIEGSALPGLALRIVGEISVSRAALPLPEGSSPLAVVGTVSLESVEREPLDHPPRT